MNYKNLNAHLNSLLYPFTGQCPADLLNGQIEQYAENQVQNFSELLCLEGEGIREDECRLYLGLWTNIQKKQCQWSKLDTRERGQVMDCYYDERGDGLEDGNHSEDTNYTDTLPF